MVMITELSHQKSHFSSVIYHVLVLSITLLCRVLFLSDCMLMYIFHDEIINSKIMQWSLHSHYSVIDIAHKLVVINLLDLHEQFKLQFDSCILLVTTRSFSDINTLNPSVFVKKNRNLKSRVVKMSTSVKLNI